jgi:hypothetical protein
MGGRFVANDSKQNTNTKEEPIMAARVKRNRIDFKDKVVNWIFDKAKTQRVNSQAEGLWVPSGGAGGTQSHVHRVVSQVWQGGI